MIEVDPSTFLSILSLLIIGPIGWMIKQLIGDVKRLDRDLSEHKVEVAENYVEKDDLHRELTDIKDMLKRLFDKLDSR